MGEEAEPASLSSLAKLAGGFFLFSSKKEQGRVGMLSVEGGGHYKCELCGKVFRSSKALGGHMRVHSIPERSGLGEGRAAVLGSGFSRRSRRVEEDQVRVACEICGKEFPSNKSLYGHMRLHPEREWRGMRPPPAASSRALVCYSYSSSVSSGSKEAGDDRQINCSDATITGPAREQPDVAHLWKSFPRWSVTGKRGKPAAVTSSSSSVQDYLGPKPADRQVRSLTVMPVEYDADPISYSLPKPETEPSPQLIDFLGTSSAPGRGLKEALGEEHRSYPDDIEKKSKKQRRLIELEATEVHDKRVADNQDPAISTPPDQNHEYKCCNKIFLSHQAYGGHVSSHNKVKGGTGHHQRRPNLELGLQQPHEAEDDGNRHWHVCEICGKRFPKGQALGGHKRLHWAAAGAAASSGEASSTAAGRQKVLNIDLNEAPPAEI